MKKLKVKNLKTPFNKLIRRIIFLGSFALPDKEQNFMPDIFREFLFERIVEREELSSDKFKGHIDVCDAIKDYLENDNNYIEIICVGHNRVFKKIN